MSVVFFHSCLALHSVFSLLLTRDFPVPRPSNIPRFPKRHASIDSPREIPLPSPSLRLQETVSPFAVAFDTMEATSPFFASRLNETVPDAAQGLNSRPSSPSVASSVPFSISLPFYSDAPSFSLPHTTHLPYHMLPRTTANGTNGQTVSISEGEQEASGRPSSLAPNGSEFSSSSSSSGSGSASSDLSPPPLVATSSSGSSASLESMTSQSSASLSYNPIAKRFSELTAFQNSRISPSTFSSYSSNGLGSAYARPSRAASPPPYLARNSGASSRLGGPRSSSSVSTHSSSSSYYMQPPEPPVVLPAEPENDDESQSEFSSQMGTLANNRQAPHVPFLSHGPAPTESYIEVETTPREYCLHVKLPGFGRDAITLASKKRRILHIVADRWDSVGGEHVLFHLAQVANITYQGTLNAGYLLAMMQTLSKSELNLTARCYALLCRGGYLLLAIGIAERTPQHVIIMEIRNVSEHRHVKGAVGRRGLETTAVVRTFRLNRIFSLFFSHFLALPSDSPVWYLEPSGVSCITLPRL